MRRSHRRRPDRVVAALVSIVATAAAARADAQCLAGRPTDPGGASGFAFDGAPVATWDAPGGRVRVHFAVEGPHAPDLSTTSPDEAPDFVVTVGEVADASLAAYEERGFRAPRSDEGGPCPSDGGDGRVDVYLVAFGAGDGQVLATHCTGGGAAPACAGFALVDHLLPGYGDALMAARTVVAHEMFHLVQHAFTGELPAWFSEATAQWAADRLHPELGDLESFLPAFFAETDRSIDAPPGGAAGAFLYGTAIWPVFLTERFDEDVVLDVLEATAEGDAVWDAHEAALAARGGSLADAFPTFAAWNAATGSRAGEVGYADAASYPEVTLAELDGPLPRLAEGATSGFSARYFRVPSPGVPASARLEDPEDRHGARWLAVGAGGAVVSVGDLPADVAGDGVVVVAGATPQKPDGAFAVHVEPASASAGSGAGGGGGAGEGGGGPDDRAAGDDDAGGDGDDRDAPPAGASSAEDDGCGCRVTGDPPGGGAGGAAIALVTAALGLRRRGLATRSRTRRRPQRASFASSALASRYALTNTGERRSWLIRAATSSSCCAATSSASGSRAARS
jgi:hypothetical protein